MKKWFTIFMSILLVFSFTACGSSKTTVSSEKSNDDSYEENNETNADNETKEKSKKVAVVYFSGTGNTEKIAKEITDVLNAEIFKIEPKEAYTKEDLNYNDENCRANKEMNDESARPDIANDLSAVSEYDTIYIGYPIWWGTTPRIVQTFLDKYDLSGKTIYTFCTSGGSGIDESVSSLKKSYPNLNIVEGHRFDSNATKDEIKKWVS